MLSKPTLQRPTNSATKKSWFKTLRSIFLLCLFTALMGIGLPAFSASSDDKFDVEKMLDTARTRIDTVQKKLATQGKTPLDDNQLVELRAQALDAQAQAETAAAAIQPELTSVQARLAELGVPTEGTPEAPDIAVQRNQLTKNSSTLDAQIKLARLISVETGQTAEQILKLRRAQFQAQLGHRTSSILAPSFWKELREEYPRDLRRFKRLQDDLATSLETSNARVWTTTLLAIAVVLGIRVLAGRYLYQISTTRVAPGRLRRSLYAVLRVLMASTTAGLIGLAIRIAIGWNSALSVELENLLNQWVGVVWFGGFVAGLGNALLAAERPSWRLSYLGDELALRLQWFPLTLAILTSIGWASQRLATIVNASLVATVAQDCIVALVLSLALFVALRRIRHAKRPVPESTPVATASPRSPWWTILLSATWIVLAVSVSTLLLGYVALGGFIIKQYIWMGLLAGSTYLITGLIEDTGNSLLASVKRSTGDVQAPAMSRAPSQAIVLISAIARLMIILLALMLLLSPFGGGPTEWLRLLDNLHTGIPVGEIQIRPTAVALAIALLVLGFAAVKLLQRWLTNQYLPTTSLDPGMRLSASTLFGYAGYVLAVAMALSAVGIGLERVAWIASALSVGIGFGLQAVVQNFVSGLILLAERPVKVGDWVSLGGVEGDIRRINVRATEIQMGDRSTVIVPNSEFITKVVRNVTHANPLGRVQIKLSLPVDTNAEQVHDIMLGAFQENTAVLDEPAPDVMLDGVDATGLVFNATGYVGSPRSAYGVRSALLFEILKQLREAALPLVNPPTMVLKEAGQASPAAPEISAFGGGADSGIQNRGIPAPEKG
ncbi:mechanosensitive ion channel family protein [Candidimonas sp. SYP-B2681]|uniref:DUF3772 domain-containing protein n=1 Tax=Candidimonas sp. SYP-B2681 TaxID=2497686 RepID=UPI000F867F1C|nr:DUF3772 domain-containing protein [Candidimonas sp. SYP-B2681]RTZ42443.1 mechanosensitive ion channel family protein [Candidimonas sp. SYP-B2681]